MSKLIKTIELSCWQNFVKLFCNNKQKNDATGKTLKNRCIWRGQANAKWEIQSSYFRDEENPIAITDRNFNAICSELKRHYSRFVMPNGTDLVDASQITAGILFDGKNDDAFESDSDVDLLFNNRYKLSDWAWAQHYGIKTPLIDWTKFPFYALFFASEDLTLGDDVQDLAIFALNYDALLIANLQLSKGTDFIYYNDNSNVGCTQLSIKEIIAKDDSKGHVRLDFFDKFSGFKTNKSFGLGMCNNPDTNEKNLLRFQAVVSELCKLKLVYSTSNSREENYRTIRQGGIFTHVPLGFSIENWLSKIENLCDSKPEIVLYKFIIKIDKKERIECLKVLNMMNINHATVYPDFEGLAKSVNLGNKLKTNNLFRTY